MSHSVAGFPVLQFSRIISFTGARQSCRATNGVCATKCAGLNLLCPSALAPASLNTSKNHMDVIGNYIGLHMSAYKVEKGMSDNWRSSSARQWTNASSRRLKTPWMMSISWRAYLSIQSHAYEYLCSPSTNKSMHLWIDTSLNYPCIHASMHPSISLIHP